MEFGALTPVQTLVVEPTTATNKGKAGPLGRKFRVEVKATEKGASSSSTSSFLLPSAELARVWTTVRLPLNIA